MIFTLAGLYLWGVVPWWLLFKEKKLFWPLLTCWWRICFSWLFPTRRSRCLPRRSEDDSQRRWPITRRGDTRIGSREYLVFIVLHFVTLIHFNSTFVEFCNHTYFLGGFFFTVVILLILVIFCYSQLHSSSRILEFRLRLLRKKSNEQKKKKLKPLLIFPS